MPNTQAVTINLTFNSLERTTPPYDFDTVAGQVLFTDGSTSPIDGWTAESVGTPQPSGAAFTLNLVDSAYSATNQTSVANWALTFLPRPGTSQASPFGNNLNTLTGSGSSGNGGTFNLDIGSNKIKNPGNWDWTLVVQIQLSDGTIHCFASDPEMDVGD